MNALRVLCPAKVNLTLEILGRRPDGYHELRTVFQAVGLHDELTITPAERDTLAVTGLPGVPTDENNLCLKAVALFRRTFALQGGVSLALHKRIPMQAGLGGGSSDAAGVLTGLQRLSGPAAAPTGDALVKLAAKLGSDVAFFLDGGAMIGSGRGEILQPVPPLREGVFVLVKPPVAVSTPAAYGLLGQSGYDAGRHTESLVECLQAGCGLPEVALRMYNGFADPVERQWPEIRQVRERLQRPPAQAALLCGSGAAVCGLFADADAAERVAADLRSEGLWVATARPLAHGVQVIEQ